jgi:hypothetical protein
MIRSTGVGPGAGRLLAAVIGVLLAGGLLVACTGDDEPEPGPPAASGPAAGGGTSALAQAAQEVTRQYLTAPEPAVVASVKGTVRAGRQDVPGTLDLLAVQAGPGSTAVRWRLSTDEPVRGVSTNYYNNIRNRLPDTDAVALVAKQANLRMLPGIWSGSGPSTNDCTCAYVPDELGPAGVELSSLYPALPDTVTEVELRVPGFPALAAPVTRS